MTFAAKETSIESGTPVELYEFQVGGTFYRYVNGVYEVIVSGIPYTAQNITRTAQSISEEKVSSDLVITVPRDNSVVNLFRVLVPTYQVNLTISRYHITDGGTPQVLVLWKGFVNAVNFADQDVAQMNATPLAQIFNREMPRQTYQGLCNHVLYDNGCRVAKTSYSDVVTVATISADGSTLGLNSLATARPLDSTFFLGGQVTRVNGETRSIVVYTFASDTVRIQMPFNGLAIGESVTAIGGCDHTLPTCKAKFNNVLRYGGFPYVPTLNPFEIGFD